MGKTLIITEKPSVARTYAQVINENFTNEDGYMESSSYVITWAVGHLVTMSYPECYDENLKKWTEETLPFIPKQYLYEVIPGVKKQFGIVKKLLNSEKISTIMYAGDSGREGIYIQMLIRQMAGHNKKADEKVVWINSQTADEIRRGIREAKDVSHYQNMTDSGYARAIEDYLVGLNFSRILSIKYGYAVNKAAGTKKYEALAVGRVMTAVLGMIVSREREIKNFVETPFYGIQADIGNDLALDWKAVPGTKYYESPFLYNAAGFKEKDPAEKLISALSSSGCITIEDVKTSTEKKTAPALFSLAELQGECAKLFKISPDKTLEIAQSLYEKKMTTYPRTDARVLTKAVADCIDTNLNGLKKYYSAYISDIQKNADKEAVLSNKKYVDDTKVTDHYAIIPTGENVSAYQNLSELEQEVFDLIVRRFLAIFYPPAEYQKVNVAAYGNTGNDKEYFFGSDTILTNPGYLIVAGGKQEKNTDKTEALLALKKGSSIPADFVLREGKTTPPKRYTSGSIILAMENAGNLIEEEELREQIKGSGIGTSATRGDTIKKLVAKEYIKLNPKTQVLSSASFGEAVYDVVGKNIPMLLSPKFTANWEKGLGQIENGTITKEEYLDKIYGFVRKTIEDIKSKAPASVPYSNTTSTESDINCTCGKKMKRAKFSYMCGCGKKINHTVAGKVLSDESIQSLIDTGACKKVKGFTSKAGEKFDAKLKYDGEKISFDFS